MNSISDSQSHQLDEFHTWLLQAVKRGPVAVVTGKNGDMDTVGSAIALASVHPSMMACGLHLGRISKRLVERHRAPFRKLAPTHRSWPTGLAGIIVVDAAAENQTGLELPQVPLCIIDHHATNDWNLSSDDLMLQWDVRATTEVVTHYLLRHAKDSLSIPVCEFLLAGLVTDTGRFKHATAASFATAHALLDVSGIDYQAFLQELESEEVSPSERGAMLRGMNRATITEAGDWSIIRTTAGTLEGKIASLLTGLGGDAVVVTRHRDGATRMTVRAPRSSVNQGLQLGQIMSEIAQSLGGEGGGHDGAAGWSGTADPVAAESAFVDAVARCKRRRGTD